MVASKLGEVKRGQSRGVGVRLIVVPDQLRQDLYRVWLDDKLVMLGSKETGDLTGIRQLIVLFLLKADGERIDWPVTHLAHKRHYRARVYPSAQERPQGYVADH